MKIGFIGCGNMAYAMLDGIISNKKAKATNIYVTDVYKPSITKACDNLGVQSAQTNIDLVNTCDIIVLAIKPQFYEVVIDEIKTSLNKDKIIVTIAPGKTLQWLASKLGDNIKIARSMPNTPAMVGEGMSAICFNDLINDNDSKNIVELFNGFGKCEIVSEKLMDVVVSVSGSSPAYIFIIIEAMADAAVADGMPREQAYKFASQAVLGSAKMVLETNMHPGALKDMVCSPGGTTIEAVRVLEEKGLRSAIFEAMKACAKKAGSM